LAFAGIILSNEKPRGEETESWYHFFLVIVPVEVLSLAELSFGWLAFFAL